MTENQPSLHDRARAIFEQLAGVSDDQRDRAIQQARATDPEACAEALALLGHHHRSDALLDGNASSAAARLDPLAMNAPPINLPTLAAGAALAGFTIIREIGHGGMGIVYEAQQAFPARRVALKLLRAGALAPTVLRRFALEAEALALLQHPSIARLYEAGFTGIDNRAPYIAMELVDGTPIDAYCRALDPREVLNLLALVCDGADHAHRKGVIHRDLKPGNILVTADGTPKVLDFGVARLSAPGGSESPTRQTLDGALIGTLGYMSPEQLSGDPARIDARSDVYALGVILYELLSGSPPISVEGMSIAEAAVALREREPTLLGTRRAALRGDVEAIAAKALERDPAQRYQTAADLAADIRRCLADEPIRARPQTTWYQARKFARRNRVLVGGVAAVFVALAAGLAATAWQARRASLAGDALAAELLTTRSLRDAAENDARRARAVTDFLRKILQAAHPHTTPGREATIREALDLAAASIDDSLDKQPEVKVEILQTIAAAYSALGKPDVALIYAQRATDLLAAELPNDTLLRASVTINHADILNTLDRTRDAVSLLSATRAAVVAAHGEQHTVIGSLDRQLGMALWDQGLVKEAEATLRSSLALLEETKGPTAEPTLLTVNSLAILLRDTQRFDEARPFAQRAYDHAVANDPPEHPDRIAATICLATILNSTGDNAQAFIMMESAVPMAQRILGENHPSTLAARQNFAALLLDINKTQAAVSILEDIIPRMNTVVGDENVGTLSARNTLAIGYETLKRYADAERELLIVIAGLRAREPDSFRTIVSVYNLARVQRAGGKIPEAIASFKEAIAKLDASAPPDHPYHGRFRITLGSTLARTGDAATGEPIMLDGFARLEAVTSSPEMLAPAAATIADTYRRIGDEAKATQWDERAASFAPKPPTTQPATPPAAPPSEPTTGKDPQR